MAMVIAGANPVGIMRTKKKARCAGGHIEPFVAISSGARESEQLPHIKFGSARNKPVARGKA